MVSTCMRATRRARATVAVPTGAEDRVGASVAHPRPPRPRRRAHARGRAHPAAEAATPPAAGPTAEPTVRGERRGRRALALVRPMTNLTNLTKPAAAVPIERLWPPARARPPSRAALAARCASRVACSSQHLRQHLRLHLRLPSPGRRPLSSAVSSAAGGSQGARGRRSADSQVACATGSQAGCLDGVCASWRRAPSRAPARSGLGAKWRLLQMHLAAVGCGSPSTSDGATRSLGGMSWACKPLDSLPRAVATWPALAAPDRQGRGHGGSQLQCSHEAEVTKRSPLPCARPPSRWHVRRPGRRVRLAGCAEQTLQLRLRQRGASGPEIYSTLGLQERVDYTHAAEGMCHPAS